MIATRRAGVALLLGAGIAGLPACSLRSASEGPVSSSQSTALTLQLAEAMIESNSLDAAIPLLRKSIAEQPDNPDFHRLMGAVLRDKGLYEQAAVELKIALKQDPKAAPTHAALGILMALMGKLSAAETHHREALRLRPKQAAYHNNLGFTLYLQGRYREAAAEFEIALRYDPARTQFHNNLGFARARGGDEEGALASFEQAGGEAHALANMAVVHHMRGDLERARQGYEAALRLDPELEAARANLDKLEPPGHDLSDGALGTQAPGTSP